MKKERAQVADEDAGAARQVQEQNDWASSTSTSTSTSRSRSRSRAGWRATQIPVHTQDGHMC